MQNLLTYHEAAEFLGVSHWTLRRYVAQKRIRVVKVNERTIRFRPTDLERAVDGMTEAAIE